MKKRSENMIRSAWPLAMLFYRQIQPPPIRQQVPSRSFKLSRLNRFPKSAFNHQLRSTTTSYVVFELLIKGLEHAANLIKGTINLSISHAENQLFHQFTLNSLRYSPFAHREQFWLPTGIPRRHLVPAQANDPPSWVTVCAFNRTSPVAR